MYDYSMFEATLQKGIFLVVFGVFALAVARLFFTALLTPFLGEKGAGMVVSMVFLGAILLAAQHAVHAVQARAGELLTFGPLAGLTEPFREITDILNSTPPY